MNNLKYKNPENKHINAQAKYSHWHKIKISGHKLVPTDALSLLPLPSSPKLELLKGQQETDESQKITVSDQLNATLVASSLLRPVSSSWHHKILD